MNGGYPLEDYYWGVCSAVFPWEMLQDCPVPGALCRHTTHDAFDDGQVWESWRWNSNGNSGGLSDLGGGFKYVLFSPLLGEMI